MLPGRPGFSGLHSWAHLTLPVQGALKESHVAGPAAMIGLKQPSIFLGPPPSAPLTGKDTEMCGKENIHAEVALELWTVTNTPFDVFHFSEHKYQCQEVHLL